MQTTTSSTDTDSSGISATPRVQQGRSLSPWVVYPVVILGIPALLMALWFAGIMLLGRDDFKPPPADTLPVPAGAGVVFETKDCGSGGCPERLLVIHDPASDARGLVANLGAGLSATGFHLSDESGDGTTWTSDDKAIWVRLRPLAASEWFWGSMDRTGMGPQRLLGQAVVASMAYEDMGVGRWPWDL